MKRKKDKGNGLSIDRLEKVSKRLKTAEPEYLEVVKRLRRGKHTRKGEYDAY